VKREITNVAASVHRRLLNATHLRGGDFNLTLQRYGAERFLYRLGASPHRDRFVLKGAMLLVLWEGFLARPTRDLDLAGYWDNDGASLLDAFREICTVPSPGDGLAFHSDSIKIEPVREASKYHGFRLRLSIGLGSAVIALQVDVGFGDAIVPPTLDVVYPVLLDADPPQVRAYPREAVVAEKLHAMVTHGVLTSRFKDFLDIETLSRRFSFGGSTLAASITATFARRDTGFSGWPPALAAPFYSDPTLSDGWNRYLKRSRIANGSTRLRADRRARDHVPGAARPRAFERPGVQTNVAARRTLAMTRPRYKAYPAYKDSGIEWLGKIPAHWALKRLKFTSDLNPLPPAVRRLPQDAEVSFVPMEAVGAYGGLDLSRTRTLADVGSGHTYFADGDVVVAKITPCFENGKGALAAALANGVAYGTTELHVLRAGRAIDRAYLVGPLTAHTCST
jgi:hypothetical protein